MSLPHHDTSDEIAERILELKPSELSDGEWAHKLGLSSQLISNYRQHRRKASLHAVLAVLRNTRVNPSWLLQGEGPKYRPRGQTMETAHALAARQVIQDLRRELDRLEAMHTLGTPPPPPRNP